jgi:hypothetical protein
LNQFQCMMKVFNYVQIFIFCIDDGSSSVLETIVEFLPFLQKIEKFVYTTFDLTQNLLLQIHGFLNLGRNELKNYRLEQLPLTRMWRTLGELLSSLAGLI